VKPLIATVLVLAACTDPDPVLGDGDFGPLEGSWTATWTHRSRVGWDIDFIMYAWETDVHCSDAASWGAEFRISLTDRALRAPGTISVIAGPLVSDIEAATITTLYGAYTSGFVTVTALDPIDAAFTLNTADTSLSGHVYDAPRCD